MTAIPSPVPLLLRLAGIVLLLLGLLLGAGGAYLIVLDGSWFYLPAGLAMAGVGLGVMRGRAWALGLALLLLAGSAVWAYTEIGTDFWQWVPRSIAFLVVALIAALAAPWLRRGNGGQALGGAAAGVLSVLLLAGIVGIFAGMFRVYPLVVASGTPAPVLHPEAGQASGTDWPAWGRDTLGNRYVPFNQINRDNVQGLEVAWTYRTGDLAIDGAEYQVTPLKIDDLLYLCTPLNKVIALDASTGEERWRFDPVVRVTESTESWRRCRGVGYADLSAAQAAVDTAGETVAVEDASADTTAGDDSAAPSPAPTASTPPTLAADAFCTRRIIATTIDARMFALDADSGELCTDFGDTGYVNLLVGLTADPPDTDEGSYNLTSAPLVADGVVMVGGRINDNLSVGEPSGVVRGFSALTGELLWAFDPARPDDPTPLPEGMAYAPESPNFWGTAAYDPELGLAYFPTGNQTPDFWTGNRHPYSDEFNDAIVAVDLQTGELRWHFRTVHIDQFDYDVAAQPILYDRPNADGSTTPLLIQLTKRGQIFVLDRRDGTPVFPVEERPVSTDAMPGMRVSETQPYSAISVGTELMKETDMWGASIFDQLLCRIQFKQMRWDGEFTPLSDQKRTIINPGYYGGFNWGGGALDAATGTLIVNDIRMAQWGQFIDQAEAERINLTPSTEGEYSPQTGTPWGVERSMFVSPLGIPCFKPPFGTLTAIDLATGDTRWQVPVGSIEDAPVLGVAPGVHIPVGMPTMGGPLVTGGGLTFFHGSLDFYTRAYDNDTGRELWRARLPVGGQGAPMSYLDENGRQFIVVVAGGATRTDTNEDRGDYVIAYALP